MNWAQSHGVAPGASWDIGASALSSPYQRPRSSLKTHRCSEIILLDDERASTRGDVEKLLGSTQKSCSICRSVDDDSAGQIGNRPGQAPWTGATLHGRCCTERPGSQLTVRSARDCAICWDDAGTKPLCSRIFKN